MILVSVSDSKVILRVRARSGLLLSRVIDVGGREGALTPRAPARAPTKRLAESVLPVLRNAVREFAPASRKLIVLLPDSEFYFKEITVPADMKPSLAALRVTLRKALGSDPKDYNLYYQLSPGKLKFIALPKKRVKELESLAAELKLSLVAILPKTYSLALSRKLDESTACAFADWNDTYLTYYRGDVPIASVTLSYPLEVFKYSPRDPILGRAIMDFSRGVRSLGVTTKTEIRRVVLGLPVSASQLPSITELSVSGVDIEVVDSTQDRFPPEETLMDLASMGKLSFTLLENQIEVEEESRSALNLIKGALLLSLAVLLLGSVMVNGRIKAERSQLMADIESAKLEMRELSQRLSGERETLYMPYSVFHEVLTLCEQKDIFISKLEMDDRQMRFSMLTADYQSISWLSASLRMAGSDELGKLLSKREIRDIKLTSYMDQPVYTFTLVVPYRED